MLQLHQGAMHMAIGNWPKAELPNWVEFSIVLQPPDWV